MEATGAASDAMPTLMPEQNLKPSHGITMDILPMDTTILAKDQLMPSLKASHGITMDILPTDTTILAKDQLMPNLKASHGTGMADMVMEAMEDTGVRTTTKNETDLS